MGSQVAQGEVGEDGGHGHSSPGPEHSSSPLPWHVVSFSFLLPPRIGGAMGLVPAKEM